MTGEAKVRLMAKQMGVSYEDALQFCQCIAFWMDKGATMEEAIVQHMKTMREGCAIALRKVAP